MRRHVVYSTGDGTSDLTKSDCNTAAKTAGDMEREANKTNGGGVHVRYRKLVEEDSAAAFRSAQVAGRRTNSAFQYEAKPKAGFIPVHQRIPWRAIALAAVLFVFGSVLLAGGMLMLGGFVDVKYSDRTWPLLILGSLMFIPGAYHVRIAWYAFRGYQGYTFDDIPDFD